MLHFREKKGLRRVVIGIVGLLLLSAGCHGSTVTSQPDTTAAADLTSLQNPVPSKSGPDVVTPNDGQTPAGTDATIADAIIEGDNSHEDSQNSGPDSTASCPCHQKACWNEQSCIDKQIATRSGNKPFTPCGKSLNFTVADSDAFCEQGPVWFSFADELLPFECGTVAYSGSVDLYCHLDSAAETMSVIARYQVMAVRPPQEQSLQGNVASITEVTRDNGIFDRHYIAYGNTESLNPGLGDWQVSSDGDTDHFLGLISVADVSAPVVIMRVLFGVARNQTSVDLQTQTSWVTELKRFHSGGFELVLTLSEL